MKLLFILRQSPYGNIIAKEALDAILASSAYGQTLSILFIDDGVFQLNHAQLPEKNQQKNVHKILSAFTLYDIDQLFVCEQSLHQRGLSDKNITIPVSVLTAPQVQELMSTQDHLLSF